MHKYSLHPVTIKMLDLKPNCTNDIFMEAPIYANSNLGHRQPTMKTTGRRSLLLQKVGSWQLFGACFIAVAVCSTLVVHNRTVNLLIDGYHQRKDGQPGKIQRPSFVFNVTIDTDQQEGLQRNQSHTVHSSSGHVDSVAGNISEAHTPGREESYYSNKYDTDQQEDLQRNQSHVVHPSTDHVDSVAGKFSEAHTPGREESYYSTKNDTDQQEDLQRNQSHVVHPSTDHVDSVAGKFSEAHTPGREESYYSNKIGMYCEWEPGNNNTACLHGLISNVCDNTRNSIARVLLFGDSTMNIMGGYLWHRLKLQNDQSTCQFHCHRKFGARCYNGPLYKYDNSTPPWIREPTPGLEGPVHHGLHNHGCSDCVSVVVN